MEIILLAVIVGGSYYGVRMGFFKLAAEPVKLVLGFIFAVGLCGVIGDAIIAPLIQSSVTNYIKDFMYENCSALTPDNVISEMPTILKVAGAAFDINIISTAGATTDEVLEDVILNLTSPAVRMIGSLFAFIILFFLSKYVISAAIWAVNSFVSVGVIGQINKSMGFILAGSLAFLGAWALTGVIDFLFHLEVFDSYELIRNFEGGLLYRFFKEFSPIELLLSF